MSAPRMRPRRRQRILPAPMPAPGAARRTALQDDGPTSSLTAVPARPAPAVASPAPQRVAGAQATFSGMVIGIDYSWLTNLSGDALTDKTVKLAWSFLGRPPSVAQEAEIGALTRADRMWLLLALKLHVDNAAALFAEATAKSVTLDTSAALDRLIAHAPEAINRPLAGPGDAFEFEALRISGMLETAYAAKSDAVTSETADKADALANPAGKVGGKTPPLKPDVITKRLPAALRHFLKAIDPAKRKKVGKDSIGALRQIADLVLEEARDFFAPFVELARSSLSGLKTAWKASGNIIATEDKATTQDDRIGYLLNRAQVVGFATGTNERIIDSNILKDANYDSQRDADWDLLYRTVAKLDRDPQIRQVVTRLDRSTGFKKDSGKDTRIGLSVSYDKEAATACQKRWRTINTISHELLHALVHPDFYAKAESVGFSLLITEGFTEVLGDQLFNDRVRPKAASDAAFRAAMEAGLPEGGCPGEPEAGDIGYAAAGAGAETIRQLAGDRTFRAAYFLGRPDLVGLK